MRYILITAIRIYQKYFSRFTRPSCRYYPSCSQYALEALEKYGSYRGALLFLKRVARCHPFSLGGHDPLQ
ncbi:MAG TPA: membrane protein insertion efficiency factor YidD [Actinobacteria bacterium]|nr:membrane protein insertion efficiency factor YidD [Actinomycetota bacterium]